MLRADGLRHAFGHVVALDDISFSLVPGRTLVIFGPNGAGKTTLLKVLAGLIHPQAGSATVAGGRRAIGWIGHQTHLYGHFTVEENLLIWAALYDVPRERRRARAAEVVRLLAIADHRDRRGCALSRGLAQRAAIARALMHDPQVLLLDEPFTGLDVAAAAEFRFLLAQLRGAGRVVVLATHNVDEGVELASDVAFQRRGRFVHFAPRGTHGTSEIAEAYRRAVGVGGAPGG